MQVQNNHTPSLTFFFPFLASRSYLENREVKKNMRCFFTILHNLQGVKQEMQVTTNNTVTVQHCLHGLRMKVCNAGLCKRIGTMKISSAKNRLT